MTRNATLLIALAVACTAGQSFGALRIDVGQDNGRKDVLAPKTQDWSIKDYLSLTKQFGDVKLTLRPVGGDSKKSAINGVLWKGGIDTGATLTCDGAAGQPGQAIELVLSGLPAGKHTLATWHNGTDAKNVASSVQVSVDGKEATTVKQSQRVASDYDAATGFVTFDAQGGRDTVVTFKPADGGAVYLNAIELDGNGDPAIRAAKPMPADGDEHAAADGLKLTWGRQGAPAAGEPQAARKTAGTSYDVYVGTDEQAVAGATKQSKEFAGTVKEASFSPKDTNAWSDYYWRVDTVSGDEPATVKGDVWHFRVARLAFPGAEGYGRFARGGRGGRVVEVTTLEDYDEGEQPIPGSYRAAVEAEGPRTIVFRVSGLIQLKRPCIIKNGNVTIAGQTAPGDGICLSNYSSGMATNDAIVRFLRVRVGDKSKKAMDGLGLGNSNNSIIDHCSISWTMDEATSSRGGHNVTFQWNLISESLQHGYHYNAADRTKLETHAFAGSISGDIGSYHHNLLAHNTDRNWSLAGGLTQGGTYAGRLDIRNNVVFNWTGRTTDGGVRDLNYVNNYYKPLKGQKCVNWLLMLDPINDAWGAERVFMSGNVMEGFDYDRDNWRAYNQNRNEKRSREELIELVRADKPLYPSYVKDESAHDAYERVLADAGATLPKRDVIDTRIAEEVRDNKTHYIGTKAAEWAKDPGNKNNPNVPGIIDTQDDVHDADDSPVKPWPNYKTSNVPEDSDHDGMPDAWEKSHGLNPNDPADGNKVGKGDYTNLEIYLNELVEKGSKGR